MSKESHEVQAKEIIERSARFGEECAGPATAVLGGELLQISRLTINAPACLSFFYYKSTQPEALSPAIKETRETLFKEGIEFGACNFFTRTGGKSQLCDEQVSRLDPAKKNYLDACKNTPR